MLIRRTSLVSLWWNSITPVLKKKHEFYFGCTFGDKDKSRAPYLCRSRCSWYLRGRFIGTHQSMPFATPVVWKEQKDHLTDCYLCFTRTDGHNSNAKHTIIYASTPDDSPPILTPPQQRILNEEEPTSTSPEDESGPSSPSFPELTVPHLISQSELNDLVRDLNLWKIQAELLASCLQGYSLIQ